MPRPRGNGPGCGQGWGGPAKGPGKGAAKPFGVESPHPGRPPAGSVRAHNAAERRAVREARVEALETMLFDLASDPDQHGSVRVTAAARLHSIYEGQPVARVINHNVDDVGQLSDSDLRNELARLSGTPADAPAGDEAAGVSAELGGVVH